MLPILLPVNNSNQADIFNIENTLVDEDLDYLYYSSRLVPSADQPRYRGCIITALEKWT